MGAEGAQVLVNNVAMAGWQLKHDSASETPSLPCHRQTGTWPDGRPTARAER